MTYKYLNDNGLKAYTKKVKGALKDLHTPIAISTENTTESIAQNAKNIADFVAKAKAAGIADVNGMAVSCLIDDDYSGVGYLYRDDDITVQGVLIKDDLVENICFSVFYTGHYNEMPLVTANSQDIVGSLMLVQGARRPIILTPETTEVDEETYQKLLSDDVDVVFKSSDGEYCAFTYGEDATSSKSFYFSCFSIEGDNADYIYIYAYKVDITKNTPHTCTITTLYNAISLQELIVVETANKLNKSTLTPVLQEIDLTGTDAERKAKLARFETNWKNLTGASDMTGARFVGRYYIDESFASILFTWNSQGSNDFVGISTNETFKIYEFTLSPQGVITITPLFSHLEPVEIFPDNSAELKKKNLDNLKAYKANLEELGVNTSKSFQVPIRLDKNANTIGTLQYTIDTGVYIGVCCASDEQRAFVIKIDSIGEYSAETLPTFEDFESVRTLAQAVKAFGAIELKASDNAANKAALTAYLKILTDAGVSTTNGYSVPVRITGNAQEYHGMLNIGTGALLSGIVTDVNENHHYPFNVSTADGDITFDANNYFLEKTSNEVTEMLDAIKYSYTPVPLTATTLSNKAQLEVFLSKVPNAKVMHVTYKDVYAGTLHKINGDWFGLLVKNTNNYEDALQVKLQADGTLIEGTTSLAQVNAKLDNIIG